MLVLYTSCMASGQLDRCPPTIQILCCTRLHTEKLGLRASEEDTINSTAKHDQTVAAFRCCLLVGLVHSVVVLHEQAVVVVDDVRGRGARQLYHFHHAAGVYRLSAHLADSHHVPLAVHLWYTAAGAISGVTLQPLNSSADEQNTDHRGQGAVVRYMHRCPNRPPSGQRGSWTGRQAGGRASAGNPRHRWPDGHPDMQVGGGTADAQTGRP